MIGKTEVGDNVPHPWQYFQTENRALNILEDSITMMCRDGQPLFDRNMLHTRYLW